MKPFLFAAAVVVVLAGCASAEAPATDKVSTTERVYRPGSNIIVKDRVPLTQEEKDKQAEEARKVLANSPRPGASR